MASAAATKAPKVLKLLDPTTVVTSGKVRFPSIKGKDIQGKLRFPNSKAAIEYRARESNRLVKALQKLTHGKNIFVYNNFRTNQVVYSFSRSLNYNNVLSQLKYHGKKTIPASLRKDMWTPYFSIHFPTPSLGLQAYKLLREFSMRRQLEPPAEMITHSEESLARKRPRDLLEAKEWDEKHSHRKGHVMMKKDRARVLMDQKATSVADVAAVLSLIEQHEAKQKENETDGVQSPGKLSNKARRRVIRAQRQQEKHEQVVRERIAELERDMSSETTGVKIDIEGENRDYNVQDGQINLLWIDLQDAQYAKSWPDSVKHGELAQTNEHIIGATIKGLEKSLVVPATQELPSTSTSQDADSPQQALPTPAKKKGLGGLKFW
ncbi:hypothetical protein FQN57_001264 [Myotisia sp. PD_48]|nr:hypothetical protein FQN57_001264 [Myotisia sp. PD_48]